MPSPLQLGSASPRRTNYWLGRCLPGRSSRNWLGLLCLLASTSPAGKSAEIEARHEFTGSVAALSTSASTGGPVITRLTLDAAEQQTPTEIQLELTMRNLDELRGRVARGEIVSRAEMQARYYPEADTHAQLAAWLREQGLEVAPADRTLLAVRARGSVSIVARALNTHFARVRGLDGNEYTSAVSAPSLPANLAERVATIGGLQAHVFLKPHAYFTPPINALFGPELVRERYQTGTLDGEGQTIAIMGSGVLNSDLVEFWQYYGVPQSIDNVTAVNVGWTAPNNSGDSWAMESTADVEWASAMAPRAKVRIYTTVDIRQFAAAVLNDLPSHPGLRQASVSMGSGEVIRRPEEIRAESQYYTALAAEGVSFFVSSGDGGSNDGIGNYGGNYDPAAALSVAYPASDPCVTAVGGTLIELNPDRTAILGESSFGSPLTGGVLQPGGQASGGGFSNVFVRPIWQIGPGVPSGAWRCVPDVSAVWSSTGGDAAIRVRGLWSGFGGTSLSSPVWAGLCALLNQARAQAGREPLGLLGPKIYPLIGTEAFNDISPGTNGAYNAASGYDLCSGVGTPNIAKLAAALAAAPSTPVPQLPTLLTQPASGVVKPGGTIQLTVSATSAEAVSYRWMKLPAGDPFYLNSEQADWQDLDDNSTFSGTHTPSLTISHADASLDGALFQCRIENSFGVALTVPAILVVSETATAVPPKFTISPHFSYAFVGGSATLGVPASGSGPLTYQWYTQDMVAIPGATRATLSFTQVTPADNGSYFLRATGPGGTAETADLLSVVMNPTISSPTKLYATLLQPFTFTVTATNFEHSPNLSNFTVSYTATGLPEGLTLNTWTGEITGTPRASGTFDVVVTATNQIGTDTAHLSLTVQSASTPQIFITPTIGAIRLVGDPVPYLVLHAAVAGGGMTCQWRKDGSALTDNGEFSGAQADTLYISTRPNSYPGNYTLVASNSFGSTTSAVIPVAAQSTPFITTQPPRLQTARAGGDLWLIAGAVDWNPTFSSLKSPTYQWQLDGQDIPGATLAYLHLSPVGSDQAGTYRAIVRGAAGNSVTDPSIVDVHSSSQLANISTRSWVGAGDNVQIAGFVVTGSQSKKILIRAAGPALAGFGITSFLPDPILEVHNAQQNNLVIATNDDWSTGESTAADIEATAARVGAFSWTRGSHDAALLLDLPAGVYSVVIRDSQSRTGIALAEVYDADEAPGDARLVNISTRAFAKTGDNVMIAGFVVSGTEPKTLLIRAGGPALTEFGVGNVYPDPAIDIHSAQLQNAVIASNDDWSNQAAPAFRVERAGGQTGAFTLTRTSKDAALVGTFEPGVYSIVLSDARGHEGNAVVEIYEVP